MPSPSLRAFLPALLVPVLHLACGGGHGEAPPLKIELEGWYITQAVQKLDRSVPLVADRDGVLRVFLRANTGNHAAPAVRVTITGGAVSRWEQTIRAPGGSVPTGFHEDRINSSWNLPHSRARAGPGRPHPPGGRPRRRRARGRPGAAEHPERPGRAPGGAGAHHPGPGDPERAHRGGGGRRPDPGILGGAFQGHVSGGRGRREAGRAPGHLGQPEPPSPRRPRLDPADRRTGGQARRGPAARRGRPVLLPVW